MTPITQRLGNDITGTLLPKNCLSVFDHFVGLPLKGLRKSLGPDRVVTLNCSGLLFLDGLNAIKIDSLIEEINEVLGHLWSRIPDLYPLDTKEDFFLMTLKKF